MESILAPVLFFSFLLMPLLLVVLTLMLRLDAELLIKLMWSSRIFSHCMLIILVTAVILLWLLVFGSWRGLRSLITLDTLFVINIIFSMRAIILVPRLRKKLKTNEP